MPRGASVHYVSAATGAAEHIPVPTAGEQHHYRPHTQSDRKPAGLDWDALTPRCTQCGEKSRCLNKLDLCPTCDPASKATPKPPKPPEEGKRGKPTTGSSAPGTKQASSTTGRAPVAGPSTTQRENPSAAQETRPAAAEDPTPPIQFVRRTLPTAPAETDAQARHAAAILTKTASNTDPVSVLLRDSALAALEALHLHHELHRPTDPRPAPVDSKDRSGKKAAGPTRKGKPSKPSRHTAQPRRPRGPEKIRLDHQAVAAAYAAGQTLREIAAHHGVSPPTIARHLNEHGITRRKQKIDYTPDLIEQVRALYVDDQLTQDDVADRLGVSTKVIQTAMRIGAIPARETAVQRSQRGIGHNIKLSDAQRAEIIDRYTHHQESAPVLAEAYGVAAASIYAVLNREGITGRHNARRPGSGGNHATHVHQLIATTGATSREIKQWALEQGLVTRVTRGIPPLDVVNAYIHHHTGPREGRTA